MIFNEMISGLNEAVGMESISDAPMTELEEMNAEIQDMVALESALDEEFAYNTLAFVDNAEATNALLAMREVGLESTQGMDPAKIYEGFGIESEIAMEAAKDVLARKAYAGAAAIKALIATCIKWLKSLFGITVASKKVFTSLAKKGKDMKKQLNKKAASAKINDEKLKREVPDYIGTDSTKGLKRALKLYKDHTAMIAKINSTTGVYTESEEIDVMGNIGMEAAKESAKGLAAAKNAIKTTVDTLGSVVFNADANALKTKTEKVKEDVKDINDIYDKSATEEKAGSGLFNALISGLGELENIKNNIGPVDDAGKAINKTIKSLEKAKSQLDKTYKDDTNRIGGARTTLNAAITLLTEIHRAVKMELKVIVRISDDLLTMSKGVLAAIY